MSKYIPIKERLLKIPESLVGPDLNMTLVTGLSRYHRHSPPGEGYTLIEDDAFDILCTALKISPAEISEDQTFVIKGLLWEMMQVGFNTRQDSQ